MGNKTALYDQHLLESAKIVDFGGWDMPLNYGSQIQEHHSVRNAAGMFDVSHMLVVDLHGRDGRTLLRKLLANDVAKLDKQPGSALYSAMLNEAGGVIDDLIVYFVNENNYRIVSNCGTRDRVLSWYKQHSGELDVRFSERNDLAIVAVQGPQSLEAVQQVLPHMAASVTGLKPFEFVLQSSWLVAKTGYTGELGVEVILPNSAAREFWCKLRDAGVEACGLGARDTLRLEAGFNLYGHEMDETVSPLAANMAWTVSWEPAEREFIGRKVLQKQREKIAEELVGIVLEERGVLRAEQRVRFKGSDGEGITTSGTFSPTLNKSIALARVPKLNTTDCVVDIRGKELSARIVSPRFVQQGKILL